MAIRNCFSKEERIEQIKALGQGIIDNAERIYGDYQAPTDLRIVINIESREFPQITVERGFIPEALIDLFKMN